MQLCCVSYFCSMKQHKISGRLDGIGITASILCAIHCAVVPFVITLLPLWGIGFLANEWVEMSMIVLALIIGTLSLSISFKRHRSYIPLFLLAAGFMLIITCHLCFSGSLEPVLIPLGGLTIATAHFVNWRRASCSIHRH